MVRRSGGLAIRLSHPSAELRPPLGPRHSHVGPDLPVPVGLLPPYCDVVAADVLLRLALGLEGVGPDPGLVGLVLEEPELLAVQRHPNRADLGNEVAHVPGDGCSPSHYNPALVESRPLRVVDLRERLWVRLPERRDVGGVSRIDGALNRGSLGRLGGLGSSRCRETEQEYRNGERTYHAESPDEV